MRQVKTGACAIVVGGLMALSALPANASVSAYLSQASFHAAVPGAVTFGFNAGGATTFLSSPFTQNGLSFSSNPTPGEPGNGGGPGLALVPVSDTPTYSADFLTFQNSMVGDIAEIDSPGVTAIGFTYGSYVYNAPSDATVWINGAYVATVTPTTTPGFIGFTSTVLITSVIFDYPGAADGGTGGYAFDLINVSAAPEPGAWVLMIVGVGGMAAVLRTRRRKVPAT